MKLVKPKKKSGGRVIYLTNEARIPSAIVRPNEEELKDDLTFDNPAYKAAKRYSKWGKTMLPPFISYYVHSKEDNCFHVPVGYNLQKMFPLCDIVDERIEKPVKYPTFSLTLRDTQKEAALAYMKNNERGFFPNGLVQLPTGKGKTILALYLASALQQRTLVIVHKDDLVEQWRKDIDLCFAGRVSDVGIYKANKRRLGHEITIATVQTLASWKKKDHAQFEKFTKMFGMIVLDECHHCPASSYDLVNDFYALYRLGLSATPERKDGLSHVMNLYFGGFAYKYKATSKDTDILPVTVIKRDATFLKIEPVCQRTDRGWALKDPRANPEKYHLEDDESFISDIEYSKRPKIPFGPYSDMVVRRIKEFVCADITWEYYRGRSILVLFNQKEQLEDYEEYLVGHAHVPYENVNTYYGNNSAAQNLHTLEYAEEHRQCVTLATYSKATEGTNVRQWEILFLVGSLNDEKNVEQAIGRVRRTKEGKLPRAIVYDYCLSEVYSLRGHFDTRVRRYRKLGFDIVTNTDAQRHDSTSLCESWAGAKKPKKKSVPVFTRGYKRK